MKRGSGIPLIFIFVVLFAVSISSAAAYNGYNNYGGFGFQNISLSALAENNLVNVALIFLLLLTVVFFVLQNVFRTSRGAAFIVSFVIGLMGSCGIVYSYGAVIPMLAPWALALIAVVLVFGIWKLFKGIGNIKWLLLAPAVLWLFWGKMKLSEILPYEACAVIDFVAIAIIIIVIFMWLIDWLIGVRRKMAEDEDRKWYSSEERGLSKEGGPSKFEKAGRWFGRKTKEGWRRGMESRRKQAMFEKRQRQAAQKLRNEYNRLSSDNARLFKQAGRIPKRGTRIGEARARNIRAMKRIKQIARKHNWRLK